MVQPRSQRIARSRAQLVLGGRQGDRRKPLQDAPKPLRAARTSSGEREMAAITNKPAHDPDGMEK